MCTYAHVHTRVSFRNMGKGGQTILMKKWGGGGKGNVICMYSCRGTYKARGSGSMLPQGKFEFLGYIRWYLRPFWTIQG